MPLPAPILDDRSYLQLRDELVRRIPVYAPEWTDHNASDPGVTLLELFAFLGENLLYRFNQIPETTKLEFLHLLQIPLRSAVPARVLVELTTDQPAGVLVPLGTEVKAGKLSYETETEALVLPLRAFAVAKVRSEPPSTTEAQEFVQRTLDALGSLPADRSAAYYVTQPAKPNAAPIEMSAAVDNMLWVAVLREDATDLGALGGALLNLGIVPNDEAPAMKDVPPCPGAEFVPRAPQVTWQISTGRMAGGAPQYAELIPVGDTTRGMTQPGVVRLRLPARVEDFGVFPESDPDLSGAGDLPPLVDDDDLADKVIAWLRVFRSDDSLLPNLIWVGANAAEVVQTRTARPEFLGTGNGQAGQSFRLVNKQVISGSLALEVEGPDGWSPWEEVDGFHASAESDKHYVLRAEAGEVQFGNGINGFVPQIGERIRARHYRYGGGRSGNVPGGAIDKVAAIAGVKVTNPMPARGGADSEPIEEALDRIPGELRRHDRAVAASDFRELALMTPGADVGRAEVLPLFHPQNPGIEAAGVVSVVVWPREDRHHPDAPLPDRSMLRTVCSWLDLRRLVTTELYVIPPSYRKVAVSVGIRIKDGYGVEAVRRWVELVIRQYLAPLPPYGPAGQGWPLGRRVHGPELEAAALQVEGIEFLEGLNVAGRDETRGIWLPGTVNLLPYEVPHLVHLTVVSGPPLAADAAPAPPPTTTPVPIPTIREEC